MFLRVLLRSLWCWGVLCAGVQAENNSSAEFRLVGGASRCAGILQVKHEGEWRRVDHFEPWDLEAIAVVCRDLDCGSVVHGTKKHYFPESRVWMVTPDCVKTFSVRECVSVSFSSSSEGLEVKCSGKSLILYFYVSKTHTHTHTTHTHTHTHTHTQSHIYICISVGTGGIILWGRLRQNDEYIL
ncbi:hypothetical protein NL108_017196 [Boleophthalmus pectinirostris]|nr:hypothetical protein NL108_017196 [Boleophthalmus pectinirostris]